MQSQQQFDSNGSSMMRKLGAEGASPGLQRMSGEEGRETGLGAPARLMMASVGRRSGGSRASEEARAGWPGQ